MAHTNKVQIRERRLAALVVIVLLLAAGSTYLLWLRTHTLAPTASEIELNRGTATPTTQVPGGSTEGQTTSPDASKGSQGSPTGTPPAPNVMPDKPTGQFVSNHQPNISGKPYPNTETSICTTTPGIVCKIKFTMGSMTKSLPPKTTDASGNAVWSDWTIQSVGLTEGTWRITAQAINSNNVVSTSDPSELRVGP